jgi:hypothetical protein
MSRNKSKRGAEEICINSALHLHKFDFGNCTPKFFESFEEFVSSILREGNALQKGIFSEVLLFEKF